MSEIGFILCRSKQQHHLQESISFTKISRLLPMMPISQQVEKWLMNSLDRRISALEKLKQSDSSTALQANRIGD
ncbi:hypothetical protein NC651_027774 [Populus alba x Populus x berolinensis]|nr:hypothetical protein NC651_027774 [Populus alba x Populus x berolinensis]